MDAAPVTPLVCCAGCSRRIAADARREVIAGRTWCFDCAAFIAFGFESACIAVRQPQYLAAVAA